MKKLKKLKLTYLSNNELGKKELNKLRGGGCCICGCRYWDTGGSSTMGNGGANNSGNLESPGGGYISGSLS
ncbi:MAG TPA: rSAM-modified peptide [Porphyromonadaceae bacterium]|nr:rSAM-modified peptide [Porphyromonadaceae bacterium]